MKEHRFTTNLNCGNCVATAKPHLDALPGPAQWSVDTSKPEKTLTIRTDASAEDVVQALATAGFEAKPDKGLFGKLFG